MPTELKAAVGASNSTLAASMSAVEAAQSTGGEVGKLFDGTLILALIAWAKANPTKITAVIAWILTMFGVPIPPIVFADETE